MRVSKGGPIGNSRPTRQMEESRDHTARNPAEFYTVTNTAIDSVNQRLAVFLHQYRRYRTRTGRRLRVLDIGCGRNPLLPHLIHEDDEYVGCDIAAPEVKLARARYEVIDLNAESLAERLSGQVFQVVFCGEVIEHLFSPDALMEEVRDVLDPKGLLILSTPNLGYWVNRLLLLFGISPLFLENSSRAKLGRRFSVLGQGNTTEGHVRLFTHRALIDFVRLHGFGLVHREAVPVWQNPIDRFIGSLVPSLGANLIFCLEPTTSSRGSTKH